MQISEIKQRQFSISLSHTQGSWWVFLYGAGICPRGNPGKNRVLGPAKLAVEEQSRDRFLEQYLLGSISIEPETESSSSNGSPITTHILPNHHQDTSEELVTNSSGQSPRETEI